MTKSTNEFRTFLKDEVNLNQSRLDRLKTSVAAVNSYLVEHLLGYQAMERQGSWALGTLIKPVADNDEYDADIQIEMDYDSDWQPKDYVNEIHRTLKQNQTYADKLHRKPRCVTIDYAGDFHLDVVPVVIIDGIHHVCNRKDNKFEETDGTGYRDWFNKKNRVTDGNLKRVVRLLKYLRDHKRNYSVKSILLTTLTGNTIDCPDEGTEEVSTIADTLVTILEKMDEFLQQHPNMPTITNPVLPSEDFNRHWDQVKYSNFRARVHSHASTARRALDESSSEKAIVIWQELFGESFGKSSGKSGNDSGDGGTSNSSSSLRTNPEGTAIPSMGFSKVVTPRKPYAI